MSLEEFVPFLLDALLSRGCTLSDMEQEAAKRGMLEAEKWNECSNR